MPKVVAPNRRLKLAGGYVQKEVRFAAWRARRYVQLTLPQATAGSLSAESLGGHSTPMRRPAFCVTLALSACTAQNEGPVIRGRVVDAVTGQVVTMADIRIAGSWSVEQSDRNGRFRLAPSDSGPQLVTAKHWWYRADSLLIPESVWRSREIRLALVPDGRPCCLLRGRWRLSLRADTIGWDSQIRAGPAQGEVVFARRHSDVFEGVPNRYDEAGSPYEPGRFQLDETPIWPGRRADTPRELDSLRTAIGRTEYNAWRRWHEGATGIVHHGDSVFIGLRISSHGGFMLLGRIRGDSIGGRWMEGSDGRVAPQGDFAMARVRD